MKLISYMEAYMNMEGGNNSAWTKRDSDWQAYTADSPTGFRFTPASCFSAGEEHVNKKQSPPSHNKQTNRISDTQDTCALPLTYFTVHTQPTQEAFKWPLGVTYLSPFMSKVTQTIKLPRDSTALMHFLITVNPILSSCAPKRNSYKTLRAWLISYASLPYKNRKNYLNSIDLCS